MKELLKYTLCTFLCLCLLCAPFSLAVSSAEGESEQGSQISTGTHTHTSGTTLPPDQGEIPGTGEAGSSGTGEGEKPDPAPRPTEIYIIGSAEDFAAFAQKVEQGESFENTDVYITSSMTLETMTVKGTFSGKIMGLGNTLTLKNVNAPLFERLDGAFITDLHFTLSEGEKAVFEGSEGALVALDALSTRFDGCSVTGSFDVEFAASEETPEDPELPEDPETPEDPEDPEDSENPDDNENTLDTFEPSAVNEDEEEKENEPSNNVFAPYAVRVAECTFVNCASDLSALSSYPSFVSEANNCAFYNIDNGVSDRLADQDGGCVYKNILSRVEISVEGALVLSEELSAEQAAELLDLTVQTNPDFDTWELSEGKLSLHFHRYLPVVTEKTCLSYAKTEYLCNCSHDPALTLTDTEGGLGEHKSDGEGETVPPSCLEEGYTLKICGLCQSEFKTDTVKATGHKTSTVGKVDATCVKEGYTGDKVCNNCGVTVSKGKKQKPTGIHRWVNPKVVKEPTADEDGEIVYSCLYCEATRSESVAAIGHERTPFEHLDDTYHVANCSCGDVIKEEHDFVLVGVAKEPTPDLEGEELYECTICKGQKTVAIPSLGHHIGVWMPEDDEMHTGLCSCGETKREEHTWNAGELISDGIKDLSGVEKILKVCTVCEHQKVFERAVELPVDEEEVKQDEKIKQYALIILAVLLIGGIVASVYIKQTDRR